MNHRPKHVTRWRWSLPMVCALGGVAVLGVAAIGWVWSTTTTAEAAPRTKATPVSQKTTASQKAPASKTPVAKATPASAKKAVDARVPLVQNFLQKHCISCHGPKDPKAGLSLAGVTSTNVLLQQRKSWENVITMVEAGEMPPDGRSMVSVEEREAFLKAVHSVYEDFERSGKPDPGQITIRRLNRTEYNNTIRDLMGVDFNPAEDFPSDDIGHGFDNIGDVLTISPVLMERYFGAAEAIVQRAILVTPPKPQNRYANGRNLQPGGDYKSRERFREIDRPMSTDYNVTQGGEFKFRLRGYAQVGANHKTPVKLALLIDGKEHSQIEIKARDSKKPETVELTLKLPPGKPKFSFAPTHIDTKLPPYMKKDGDKKDSKSNDKKNDDKKSSDNKGKDSEKKDGEKKNDDPNASPKIFVENLQLEGPMDTRPPSQLLLLACSPNKTKAEQSREVLTRFARRAYRRPPEPSEIERLLKLASSLEAAGEPWEAAMQFAMQAVLISPKFLFRVELDNRPDSPEAHPISEFQLASRLSYFLWASMPDDELFRLAEQGQLSKNLPAQVKRMLVDPKATSLVDQFAMQWLQLERLKTVQPDTKAFPKFNEPLRQAMLEETRLYITAVIQEDRSILDLIGGDFTFLNEPLANLYGVVDTNGNGWGADKNAKRGTPIRGRNFQRVALKSDSPRGGILTQASVLTVTSNPTRTSPVKRGRWVLEQVLGTPPPPPPPNVPELEAQDGAILTGSLRQRMEQHRANPSCANCHARMDPLGFAFENFDAIGAFRDKDAGIKIDPSGVLPDGRSFQGPAQLKDVLKDKKDMFARNLAEKLLIYGLGRGLEYYDKSAVDKVTAKLAKEDYKFSSLATAIVESEPFRMRRGKDTAK